MSKNINMQQLFKSGHKMKPICSLKIIIIINCSRVGCTLVVGNTEIDYFFY